MKQILANPYVKVALLMIAAFLLFNISAFAQTDYVGETIKETASLFSKRINQIGYISMGLFFTVGLIIIIVQGIKLAGNDPNAKDAIKTTAIVTIIILALIYVFMTVGKKVLDQATSAA